MTLIRPARPAEIPALCVVDGDDERNAATAAYLMRLLEAGCTCADWCLVAEADDGRLAGSVVLWAPPGGATPVDFVLFEPGDTHVGKALLDAAGALARALGAATRGHVLDTPGQAPQFQRDPQLRQELLAAAGFGVERDGRRYLWQAGDSAPFPTPDLSWRNLAEVGEGPFVDLLEDVLEDTADALLRAEVARHGQRDAAARHFKDCLQYEHQPQWYEVGYAPDGSPAALSLPARTAASAIISMVGVSKAHRGKGYAAAVVARGTQILAGAGATEIRGDCDAANIAMTKAFERCGYTNFANRRMFRRAL
ncbi:GNAT family N-acetyltransferase [Catellatospora tritici]|uniref:GNAT family N-acetyltransferase n=1 Tax=Catellatospora tritici TaxID=2851566 RepID=UPI001C2DDC14|nr:GNAT family N-acetyltransferase [Catellatospora tritici]MBV1850792.1 GNAT family N-acetyltransferase [Catellatospora tritici]MBV1851045.1 GNAT family N-acetyltransferase [Catellatospora tritici]